MNGIDLYVPCGKCGTRVAVARSPSDGHPELLSKKAAVDHGEDVHETNVALVPVPPSAYEQWGAQAWWTIDRNGRAHVGTEPPPEGVARYRTHRPDCKRFMRGQSS